MIDASLAMADVSSTTADLQHHPPRDRPHGEMTAISNKQSVRIGQAHEAITLMDRTPQQAARH